MRLEACFSFIGSLVEIVYFLGKKRLHRTLSKGMGLDPSFKQAEGQLSRSQGRENSPYAETMETNLVYLPPTMVHLGKPRLSELERDMSKVAHW